MIKKLFFAVVVAVGLIGNSMGFPVLSGRVVDEANILNSQQKYDLEKILEQADPHQVVAVSLESLDGKEIEEYGYQLGRHWGIGRKDENDGVLVLIAPNERQLRIEVGYGLEHILTDAQSSIIINSIMIPLAREGKYDEALMLGAVAVIDVLNGHPVQVREMEPKKIPIFIIDIFLLLILLLSLFGRKGSYRGGGFFGGGGSFGGGSSFHGGGGSFGGGGASGRF